MLARQSTPADIRKRDIEACVLAPFDPGGEVGAKLLCELHNRHVGHRAVLIVAADRYMGLLELKKCLFKLGCFGCGVRRDFLVLCCLIDWHKIIILFPLHCL